MAKPTFLNTKGQRSASDGHDTDDLLERYVRIFCGRFRWSGLPEGCPESFPERAIFFSGALSAKKVRGLGICLMGAKPSALTIYGTPARWMPSAITGETSNSSVYASLWDESDNPVMCDGVPMCDRIAPYLELQRKALNALGTNLVSLTSPVMVEAAPGQEMKGKIIANNLGSGDVFIPVIDRGAAPAAVLDLHATDHTANLLGVVHDTHGQILDIMFVPSAMEKASGITVEEATSSFQQLEDGLAAELRKRRTWCELINAKLGTSIACDLPETEEVEEQYESTETDQDARAGQGEAGDRDTERTDSGSED